MSIFIFIFIFISVIKKIILQVLKICDLSNDDNHTDQKVQQNDIKIYPCEEKKIFCATLIRFILFEGISSNNIYVLKS